MGKIDLKKNDNWVTPPEAVKPLIREFSSLKECKLVDVFGNSKSEFNAFQNLLDAKISYDDFFELQNDTFLHHTVITTPPFSKKDETLIRLLHLYQGAHINGFAILLPLQSLQGFTRGALFRSIEGSLRVRIFSNRIKYLYPDGGKQRMLGSIWVCYGGPFVKGLSLRWY